MANAAFFIYGINPLKGGGGAERFFSDFYEKYLLTANRKYNLYFITDKTSVKHLNEVGKLGNKSGVLYFHRFSNRFKVFLETLQLYFFILVYRIRIIHLPLYNISYIPLLQHIDKMPAMLRPKIAINIVNCYLAATLQDAGAENHVALTNTYQPLFKHIKADGYFCWNKSFEEYAIANHIFSFQPKSLRSITSRFSDVDKFFPGSLKKNQVVFAARLDGQKHPEWFVQAVGLLNRDFPDVLNTWKFLICGNGPLRPSLIALVKEQGLDALIEFRLEGQMENILNDSKIYVSCQDFDNFPSLTMTEAMASGNAIVARNVGQTDLFVKAGRNGLFIEPDNTGGLAKALHRLLSDEAKIESMGKASETLIKEVHNYSNFVSQIEAFWKSLEADA